MSTREQLLRILKNHWGYDYFRPMQVEAMEQVMAKRDSVVILPTGGGKSLCFQAPAMLLPGTALVVSPLISLMKDQVDALRELDIPAGKLHSGMSTEESRSVYAALTRGELKLLYVSPERLLMEGFESIMRGAPVSFLAVDEAHCISEWGHDFRPEYRQLNKFRSVYPDASIHAFTATATPRVSRDMAQNLGMRRPETLVGSFDRPNLFYRVLKRAALTEQIVEVAERHPGESGIVYCISRKDTEAIATALQARGVSAKPYHAGLPDVVRSANQDEFINDGVQVMVATIAFGMGIDKPDVRFVVHAGMPRSLENYQQESGRAGRDGLAAECVLIGSGQDFMKWMMIMKEQPRDVKKRAEDKLRPVDSYIQSWSCRRRTLLAYFGEDYEHEKCPACDFCVGGLRPAKDGLVVAQKILSCVKRLGEAQPAGYVARVLLASEDPSIRENGHDALSTFGLLRDADPPAVRNWIEQLVSQGMILRDRREDPLRLTNKGWEVIRGQLQPQLMEREPQAAKVAPASSVDMSGVDPGLFDFLKVRRLALAKEKSIPPYAIFQDRTLIELARIRPSTVEGFRKIHGIGEAKSSHYGEYFVNLIRKYCREVEQLPLDVVPQPAPAIPPTTAPRTPRNLDVAAEEAHRRLREGGQIEEVAAATSRAVSTVEGYLCDVLMDGCLTDASPWVEPALIPRIEELLETSEDNRLKPIYVALGEKVPYWKIRAVAICRRNRTLSKT